MKKVFRNLGLVLALVLTVSNVSAGTFIDAFNKISIKNEGSVTVKVFDSEGEIIYTEAHNGNYIVKEYDFSQLPDGEYYMSIDTEVRKISKWFTIENHELASARESISFRPSLRVKGNDVYVSKYALDQSQIIITIVDVEGVEVYETSISATNTNGKGLSLAQLPEGTYKIFASNKAFKAIEFIDVK